MVASKSQDPAPVKGGFPFLLLKGTMCQNEKRETSRSCSRVPTKVGKQEKCVWTCREWTNQDLCSAVTFANTIAGRREQEREREFPLRLGQIKLAL
ncbi:uncharacterized [Tachysurus ichikawai]